MGDDLLQLQAQAGTVLPCRSTHNAEEPVPDTWHDDLPAWPNDLTEYGMLSDQDFQGLMQDLAYVGDDGLHQPMLPSYNEIIGRNSEVPAPLDTNPVPNDQLVAEKTVSGRSQTPVTEFTFLSQYPRGKGALSFQDEKHGLQSIYGVNLALFEKACPMLAMAFEPSKSGSRLYLETLTPLSALPFLRFIYTGTYALGGSYATGGDDAIEVVDIFDDAPSSVLLHTQLYRLGDLYELPDLKRQAYVNVIRQCEFACSSPEKPIDLCAAIRYIYEHLPDHEKLIEAIVSYCVCRFLAHGLPEDPEFKDLAYDLRPFHQDLCKCVMARNFENDTALAIIQMPFKTYMPETYASREDVDCIYRFHGDESLPVRVKSEGQPIDSLHARASTVQQPAEVDEDAAAISVPQNARRLVPLQAGFVPTPAGNDSRGYRARVKREQVKAGTTTPYSDDTVSDGAGHEEDHAYPTETMLKEHHVPLLQPVVRAGASSLDRKAPLQPQRSYSDLEMDYEHVEADEFCGSDSDTNSSDYVHIRTTYTASGDVSLPIRSREDIPSQRESNEPSNDSDSDWSLL